MWTKGHRALRMFKALSSYLNVNVVEEGKKVIISATEMSRLVIMRGAIRTLTDKVDALERFLAVEYHSRTPEPGEYIRTKKGKAK